jgi:hypothetical protein
MSSHATAALFVISLALGACSSSGSKAGNAGGTSSSAGGTSSNGTGGTNSSSGGASAGGSGGTAGGSAGDAGSAGAGNAGGAGAGGAGQTITDVYITWYGFNDNSCQVETQHDCNTIAFPMSDGFPTVHDIATEGTGRYADPITFATAANDSGTSAEITVGHLIYVPYVRKYFVMEDQCYECGQEWDAQQAWHVDLWMGPSYGSDDASLTSCEDSLTLGSTYSGTGTIIVDPPSNLPVDTTPLFTNNTCSAHTY